MADKLKIALAQISCKRADKTSNIEKMKAHAEKAKKEGAELVIFPELSLTDYLVRDLIYELAEPIPGPSVEKMAEIAKQNKIYIVFGMPEMSKKAESVIYNTCLLYTSPSPRDLSTSRMPSSA